MKPELVDHKTIKVLGIQRRIDPMKTDYQKLWRDELAPYYATIGQLGRTEGWFGVYFPCEEEGKVDFIAGMAVGDLDEVPEGLVVREVPAARMAVFTSNIRKLGDTWRNIYESWLGEAGLVEDETTACFEYFPPGAEMGNADVSVNVPVKE
jgi:AraC family transcriptional regulator